MVDVLSQVAGSDGFRLGLIGLTFGFGLRHGIDWDHIAAITDITGSQDTSRRSMLFATLYAVGHGAVVFVLGVLAILAGEKLPSGVDSIMERLVGVTLLVLGVYVLYSLIRHGRDFRMRSRWMLIFSSVSRAVRWARTRGRRTDELVIEHDHEHPASEPHPDGGEAAVRVYAGTERLPAASTHRHEHRHRAPLPDDPFTNYGVATSIGVGMIHGIGAETPTQVLLFLTAAGASGPAAGVFLLLVFLAGLITSNSLIALASTFSFLNAARSFAVYAAVAVITAVFSLGVGALFLLGEGRLLPAFFGG